MTRPDRIAPVIELLTRLATGDLEARGARIHDDEDLDAVIFGINMLAEELSANRIDLEKRIEERTHDLDAARREAVTARKEAEAATVAKSAFLATMSHEIRTPMNGVIGLTTLLLHTGLDETQLRYVKGLRDAGSTLLTLIDDILDFSKIEAGMLALEQATFDPRRTVDAVAALVAPVTARKQVELVVETLPEVPAQLVGDEARVRQVLLNLASNAVKFTETGEVVIRTSLNDAGDEQTADPGPAWVRFEVVDTGVGIPRAAQEILFESFTQAEASTTRKYGGTGLGLAISRSLVDLMGGSIGFTSEERRGSTFWFAVPLTTSPAPVAATPTSPGLAGARILVVEDNATQRRVLTSQLAQAGMRPDAAEHPDAVLSLMQTAVAVSDPYAVVLLDARLQEVDGLGVAASITADPALGDSRLVLLSASAEIDPDALLRAGVRTVVTKPVRAAELQARLTDLITPVAAAPGHPGAVATPRHSAPRRGRVLVVEDNAINQLVAEGLLTELGFDVDIAPDGKEALEAVAAGSYAVVLMDCRMPVMDGFEATAAIRSREVGARLPIIAMTASATEDDRRRAIEVGMDGFIPKPVDAAILEQVLSHWVPAGSPAPATASAPAPAPAPAAPPAQAPAAGPVLDLERVALLRSLGRAETGGLLPALVDAFAASAPALARSVADAAGHDDWPTLRAQAHQLAGAADNIGAVAAAALARTIEQHAADGTRAPGDLYDRLETEVDRAVGLLAGALLPAT